jgi:hypothetical protein
MKIAKLLTVVIIISLTPSIWAAPAEMHNIETITATEEISTAIGTKFGVRFNLGGKSRDQGRIQMLYLTPGVVDEKGYRYDKYEVLHMLDRSLSNHVMAFEITEAYEQVEGTWTFLIFEEDRLLLKQQFELIDTQ